MDVSTALSLVGLEERYGPKFQEEEMDLEALSLMTAEDFLEMEVEAHDVPLLLNLAADLAAQLSPKPAPARAPAASPAAPTARRHVRGCRVP